MIFKMAFRNIFRHKRRTFLTSLMMLGGYCLISFSLSLVDGSYGNLIRFFTSQKTGHLQIHHKKYVETESIHDNIKNYKQISSGLSKDRLVEAFSPRIKSGALAFKKEKAVGVQLIGIDWTKEALVTTIKKRLEKGHWPSSQLKNEVIIGGKIAKVLNLNLGDELILISQGADGSIANDIFYVKAIFQSEDQALDDYSVYTDLSSAQSFFSTKAIQEIAIKLKRIDFASKFAKSFNPGENLVIRPWQKIEEEFFRAMEVDKKGNTVSYIIIMIVVALGILNSVLMSILERIKEFGVLKAIGTSPKNLIMMIIMEAQFIAIISVIFGAILSFFINLYFVKYGISLSEPMTYGGMFISHIFAEITPRCFVQPALIVFGTSFLVSLYPAFKSARVSPVEALREN